MSNMNATELNPDVVIALESLGRRLCLRPNWKQNYLALNGGQKSDDARVMLALIAWLKTEFSIGFTTAEIKSVEATLVTRHAFAPDCNVIRNCFFDTAMVGRLGELRSWFSELSGALVRWSAGEKIEWSTAQAWAIKELGARYLMEADFGAIASSLKEAMARFIAQGEPDVRGDVIFSRALATDVRGYAAAPRVRRNFVALKKGLT